MCHGIQGCMEDAWQGRADTHRCRPECERTLQVRRLIKFKLFIRKSVIWRPWGHRPTGDERPTMMPSEQQQRDRNLVSVEWSNLFPIGGDWIICICMPKLNWSPNFSRHSPPFLSCTDITVELCKPPNYLRVPLYSLTQSQEPADCSCWDTLANIEQSLRIFKLVGQICEC